MLILVKATIILTQPCELGTLAPQPREERMNATVLCRTLLAGVLLAAAQHAAAQIKVGVTLALTGPAAVLGLGARNALDLYPTTIAGQKIEYIVLDDASDTTGAVTN